MANKTKNTSCFSDSVDHHVNLKLIISYVVSIEKSSLNLTIFFLTGVQPGRSSHGLMGHLDLSKLIFKTILK